MAVHMSVPMVMTMAVTLVMTMTMAATDEDQPLAMMALPSFCRCPNSCGGKKGRGRSDNCKLCFTHIPYSYV